MCFFTGSLSSVSFSFLHSFLRIVADNMEDESIKAFMSGMAQPIRHMKAFTYSDSYFGNMRRKVYAVYCFTLLLLWGFVIWN